MILNNPGNNGDIISCKITNICGSFIINKKFIPISSNSTPCPVSARMSIKDPFEFTATVYPNPTTDIWTVQIPIYIDNSFTFSLFDINGRNAFQAHNIVLDNSNFSIDGQPLHSGMYVLKIKDKNNKELTFKLIKK